MARRTRTFTRSVPRRTKQNVRLAKRESIIQRSKRLQQQQNFLSSVRRSVNSLGQSISNVKNIDTDFNKYLNENINNIPTQFRPQFISLLRAEKQNVLNRQKAIERNLNNKLQSLKIEQSDAQRNLRNATTPSGRANALAGIENIRGREEAVKKALNELNKGSVLDTKQLNDFIRQSGNIRGEKSFAIQRVSQQIKGIKRLQKQAEKTKTKSQKVALKQAIPTSIRKDAVKEIQKKLNVTKKQAEELEEAVTDFDPRLTVEKFEKPKNFFDRVTFELNLLKDKALLDVQKSEGKKPLRVIGTKIVVLGGLGVVRGVNSVINVIRKPGQTIRGLAFALTNPGKTVVALQNEFYVDPVGTVAEFWAYGKTAGIVSTGIKRSPVGQYVAKETFIARAPKEVRRPLRAVLESEQVQRKINPYNVKTLKKVDFSKVKGLNKVDAKALEKTLKQTDSVVFGSLASFTLSKKKTPIPKDVDLATANIKVFNKKFLENVPKRFRNNYKLKGEKIIRTTDNTPILDVKSFDRLYPGRTLFSKKGWLPVENFVYDVGGKLLKKLGVKQKVPKRLIEQLEIPTQRVQKVGGIKLVGFGEQTTRKGLGTIQVLIERNVRRAKDPASFIKGLEVQVGALKRAKPKNPITRLSNARKITKLNNALKILKSKSFAKLLEKKVPGLNKEYPILKKINVNKLKKATASAKKVAKKVRPKPKAKPRAKPKLKKSRLPSKLPKKRPSKLPSKLPKKKPSKLPSKLPSKIPSKIPSRLPSKLPSRLPKRTSSKPPSKVPSKPPSKTPSKVPSKPPSKTPSKPPSKPPSKVPSKPPSKVPSKPPGKPPRRIPNKPPLLPPPRLKKPSFKKKPKGQTYLVDSRYKSKGKIRTLRLRTTYNRALKYMINLIDNTTARSFDLVLVGLTKAKDIKRPSLAKFRQKISKNGLVLNVVERTKYAIDTTGEKRGLSVSKYLKRGKRGIKRKKKKTKKRITKKKRKKRKK